MICEKPTRAYPDGRTGTDAGWAAHMAEKSVPCDPCKEAHADYCREWERANAERRRSIKREYRAENKDKINERRRKSYRDNNYERRAQAREYWANNRERILERERDKRKENPEHERRKGAHRRMKKSTGNLAPIKPITDRGKQCVCCATSTSLEIDHRIPITRGGSDHSNNHQTLCRSCNSSKKSGDWCWLHDVFLGVEPHDVRTLDELVGSAA